MKKYRLNVFETNSSSVHTFTCVSDKLNKSVLRVSKDRYIHVKLGNFGRDNSTYHTQLNRLSYLVTMCAMVNGYYPYDLDEGDNIDNLNSFMECDDFKYISSSIADYVLNKCNKDCIGVILDESYGYIDHQSCENFDSLHDFLSDINMDVVQFVFGDVEIYTTSD